MKFNQPLNQPALKKMQQKLEQRPGHKIVANAVMANGINQTALNAQVLAKLNHTFSIDLPTGTVSNQKHSGRCWLFSILNTLRHQFATQYQVKDFELSQSYLFFWDKIERANIFYDRMIALAGRPTDDREVAFYLSSPGTDGGQWAMAAALVQKYGVVPRETFPETAVTEDTSAFDMLLNHKMRHDAMQLRELVNQGATDAEIASLKQQFMDEIYRITGQSVGVPPAKFDLEYRDDAKKYHLDQGLTPQEFYAKYIGVDLDQYVVLANAPDKKYGEKYALPSQDNVEGGKPIEFLNAPMDQLKQAAIQQLQAGETIWFGNDVLQQMDRQKGILDSNLFLQDELFGIDTKMSKAERMRYHEAEVSHAMTLTGVDVVNGKPTKWKVENSWGAKIGNQGYFVMADNWMDDYTYEVVVKKSYLSDEIKQGLTKAPIVLAPWDSLA
ncbi:C1 family peptidase [Fructilactobacillus frigidiflavus]|uniref:C1 family peptidase n=1 Tax=Fructilactobacillus frigidiflavus TaxID=3242688 RepID=UPI0037583412